MKLFSRTLQGTENFSFYLSLGTLGAGNRVKNKNN